MDQRLIILETLLLLDDPEMPSGKTIKQVLDKYSHLKKQERSFIKRILEGCLERRIELDYIINCFSKTKTNRMKPVIRAILRMSVYQLKYMDSIPASAVCNEAVKLAEKKGFSGLKGFVNGVLRSIARQMNEISEELVAIAMDGKIDDEEMLRLQEINVTLDSITKIIKNIKEKMGMDM